MDDFKSEVLAGREVSVWGTGYLGYSTILMLQSRGFVVKAYNFDGITQEDFENGGYPDRSQLDSWSVNSQTPPIDTARLQIVDKVDDMFSTPVHIISLPSIEDATGENYYHLIAGYFSTCKILHEETLVIFQAAEKPGNVEKNFIELIEKYGINCSVSSAFRSDWTLEEYFDGRSSQLIAGSDENAVRKAGIFFDLLGIDYDTLPTIKEAELYENTKNSIRYLISTHLNQISCAYADTDIRKMACRVLDNIEFSDLSVSMGISNLKMATSLDHLVNGARYPRYLPLVGESQTSNVSNLLNYAEILKKQSVESVTVLGVSVKGDIRDIRLSASLIFIEYLNTIGINVFVHDPFYSSEELKQIVPFAEYYDMDTEAVKTDAVVLMVADKSYRFLTQSDIDRLNISNTRIVIDNAGVFCYNSFSDETIYHIPGDGKLSRLVEK